MLSRFACWTLPCARDAVVTPLEGARRDVHKRTTAPRTFRTVPTGHVSPVRRAQTWASAGSPAGRLRAPIALYLSYIYSSPGLASVPFISLLV